MNKNINNEIIQHITHKDVGNSLISAEIPDPLGCALVSEFMMHGPGGQMNQKYPCMKNDVCSKHYPKSFNNETSIDAQGFVVYKRRNNGRYVIKNGHQLDNSYVVPYNMFLLKKYHGLIDTINYQMEIGVEG
jgi:hypothetical protein